jgi:hypothetical protein
VGGGDLAFRARDRLLLAVLVAYFAMVVLAAWPAPVRPAALEAAHDTAGRWLQYVSILPGHSVFAMRDRASSIPVADCFYIRGSDARGGAHDVWPPDGRCVRRGVRFRIPPLAIFLARTLNQAGSTLSQPNAAVAHGHAFAAIGRTFCDRHGRGEPDYESVALAWVRDVRSYQDGSQLTQPVLVFSWACTPQQFRFVKWFPQGSELRSLFGDTR